MTPVSERSRGLRPKHQIFVHLCGLVFRFVFFTVVALMCLFLSSIVLSYIRRERECVCVLCRRERECVCVLCRRERESERVFEKNKPPFVLSVPLAGCDLCRLGIELISITKSLLFHFTHSPPFPSLSPSLFHSLTHTN